MTKELTIKNVMSIREIMEVLYDRLHTRVIINHMSMTNREAYEFLYVYRNQDKLVKVIQNRHGDNALTIWIID